MSPTQTVLWDQIEYSGNPAAFAWVLPIHAGAVVQLSHDEWFAALDAMTAPVITGPTTNCGGGGGSGGCLGSTKAAALSGDSTGNSGVQVISQTVVGPYDTATLRSTDPHALETWLDANGYAISDAFRPTIAAYVSEGFDFIALRLQPGQGVQSMQPVRVVTAGADPTLPLRMVAAGAGAQVGITLYVISEGRYEAQSPFFNAVIDGSKLVWQHSLGRSNYQDLSQSLMQSNGGRTWLTEFAGTASLATSSNAPGACPFGSAGGAITYSPGESLGDVYYGQCQCNAPTLCAGPIFDLPASEAGVSGDAGGDAGVDAGGDADVSVDSGAGGDAVSTVDAGACGMDPCAAFDDLDVALVGLHPGDTWVTRLRSILPAGALSEGDLHIQAATPQTPVSNFYRAAVYDDPAYNPCPGGGSQGGCSAGAAPANLVERGLVPGGFAFLAAALVRRRVRRRLRRD